MPEKARTTPKDFFLWAGAMITLYASAVAFVSLIFSYLNYAFPDRLSYGYYGVDPYSGGISYQMASLIVLFPIFLVLMRLIRRDIDADQTRADVWVRRWALYLTLFVAGATVAGDLITLIMYFFNGDVSMRFVLKILVVLLVSGAGFLHFLADLRGYWREQPSYARMLGWAAGGLVIITIIAGFFIVGTPWQARQYRFDEQRVNDLSNIQSQVVSYWQAKEKLPADLGELNNAISGYAVANDPETGAPYEYRATGALSFELCATFNAPTQAGEGRSSAIMPASPYEKGMVTNWSHGAGRTCYARTIDPELYPPLSSQRAL
jgi:hypothetical protein